MEKNSFKLENYKKLFQDQVKPINNNKFAHLHANESNYNANEVFNNIKTNIDVPIEEVSEISFIEYQEELLDESEINI